MLSYVNNKFCSIDKAQISVNDRGYQFGDAVYEVIYYKNGKFLDLEGHLKRLRISMSRIDFELNYSEGIPYTNTTCSRGPALTSSGCPARSDSSVESAGPERSVRSESVVSFLEPSTTRSGCV